MISYTETSFFEQLTLFEKELDIKIKDDYRFVELNFIRIFCEEKLESVHIKIASKIMAKVRFPKYRTSILS